MIEAWKRARWIRSRDPSAVAEFAPELFYETWFPKVYAYFARRTAGRDRAEDLTSETFERILRALPDFRPGEDSVATRAWVYRIAANVYKNRLRGEDRRQARDVAWAEGWEPVSGEDPELSLAIGQAVTRLDPRDREVLGLRYWEDLTAKEIGSVLGLEQRQVYTILDRCMRELRRQLEPAKAGLAGSLVFGLVTGYAYHWLSNR